MAKDVGRWHHHSFSQKVMVLQIIASLQLWVWSRMSGGSDCLFIRANGTLSHLTPCWLPPASPLLPAFSPEVEDQVPIIFTSWLNACLPFSISLFVNINVCPSSVFDLYFALLVLCLLPYPLQWAVATTSWKLRKESWSCTPHINCEMCLGLVWYA